MNSKPIVIGEVWASNFDFDFELIRDVMALYPFISMDTEFLGLVFRSSFSSYHRPSDHYRILKSNVDALNLIQVGLTLLDVDQLIHFSELERLNQIGSGSGGMVSKVVHKPSGRVYVLKVAYGSHEVSACRQICREIEILRYVDNRNFVKCHDMFDHNCEIQVLLEFMDRGFLEGFLTEIGFRLSLKTMAFWWSLLVLVFAYAICKFLLMLIPHNVPSIQVDASDVLDNGNQIQENSFVYVPPRGSTQLSDTKVRCYESATMNYLGDFPALTPDEVKERVAQASKAQRVWAKSSFKQRFEFL